MPVFLFPGQGSQKAGAAKLFYEGSDAARSVLDRAIALLPDDVASVLLEGEQDALNYTRNAQPILVCLEIAIATHLMEIGVQPEICTGHSLGEIAALAFSGAMSLETTIAFVVERARLMSENVPEGGMAAVIGVPPDDIEPFLDADTQIANYNGTSQTIISGATVSLGKSVAMLKEHGVRRVMPLQVSGPFHSKYMKPAADALKDYLAAIEINTPHFRFLSSVSGEFENDPERIRMLLSQQLYSPVRWTNVMEVLDNHIAVEVGPGTVLAGLAKRSTAAPKVFPADTLEACQKFLSEIMH